MGIKFRIDTAEELEIFTGLLENYKKEVPYIRQAFWIKEKNGYKYQLLPDFSQATIMETKLLSEEKASEYIVEIPCRTTFVSFVHAPDISFAGK